MQLHHASQSYRLHKCVAKVLMCSAHLELLGGQQAIAVGIQGLKGLPQHLPGSTESKHVETCRNMSKHVETKGWELGDLGDLGD